MTAVIITMNVRNNPCWFFHKVSRSFVIDRAFGVGYEPFQQSRHSRDVTSSDISWTQKVPFSDPNLRHSFGIGVAKEPDLYWEVPSRLYYGWFELWLLPVSWPLGAGLQAFRWINKQPGFGAWYSGAALDDLIWKWLRTHFIWSLWNRLPSFWIWNSGAQWKSTSREFLEQVSY